MYRKRLVSQLALFLLLPTQASAQDGKASEAGGDTAQIIDLSLEELMNLKVTLPSRTVQREELAPAVVSVVTRADIEAYGARDMADILRLVPGFEFGHDGLGLVGLGFRGIWVHEGKILMMINGVTFNDLGYGNGNFIGSLPAEVIERVEILRGPGSALYGGFAESGAINIITRPGSAIQGGTLQGNLALQDDNLNSGGNLSFGTKTDDLEIAAHVGTSNRTLSDRTYYDFFGNQLELGDSSRRKWDHILIDATYKDSLFFRYNRTKFLFSGHDGFAAILPPVNGFNIEEHGMHTDGMTLKYRRKLGEKWTIEPSFEFLTGNSIASATYPSSVGGTLAGPTHWLDRYTGDLALIYQDETLGQVLFGVGHMQDRAKGVTATGEPVLELLSGAQKFETRTYSNYVYTQYSKEFENFGLTLGGRFDDSIWGNSTAPRAGLTYAEGEFNAKILYGKSFRMPLPWQAYARPFNRPSQGLSPETSETYEFEVGYRLSQSVRAKVNAFLIHIFEPITYISGANSYGNFGKFTSQGFEGELIARYAMWGGFFNFSFHKPGSGTSYLYVTTDGKNYLGLPPLKLNTGAYYKIGSFQVGPTVTYLSERYGQSQESAITGIPGNVTYKPTVLANATAKWTDAFAKDTELSLSLFNIFNTRYTVIQPYYGAHAPVPANDFEIRLDLKVNL